MTAAQTRAGGQPPTPTGTTPPPQRRSLRSYVTPEVTVFPILVIVIIAGALLNSRFLSYNNIFGILQQFSELSVLVMGLTLVLITGKFDLSLESIFGLAPMVAAFLFLSLSGNTLGLLDSPLLALVSVFVIGALIGAFNGFLVVYLKFNAFIATLATLILLRGVALGLTEGETLSGLPPLLTNLGQQAIAGVPASFVVALVVLVVLSLFMTRHRAGRMLYAIGGNAQAARVAGVRVERVTFLVFMAAGVLALIVSLVMHNQRTNTSHREVIERHDDRRPPAY